ncbi:hypothetical protein N0V94_006911 [Neodidymelliopsis sp. IMI 364377]|nr:hypothetical protein N0V94_006911 [Neodidymelliopsis sp. IMI 364377]
MSPYLNDTTPNSPSTASNTHETFLKAPDFQTFDNPPRVLVIGAGSRGIAYAEATLNGTNAVIAAVCEPVAYKRAEFGRKFIWKESKAREEQQFSDWKEWVAYEEERRTRQARGDEVERGVDAVFVCVLDEFHEEVVCGIAHLKVHVCCEKPMSTRLESCVRMYKALTDAKKSAVVGGGTQDPIFGICHVLRYSPHNMLLRHLVREKKVIGDVLSIEHTEPVGYWHYSHSYVRGNWRKESTSAPSLLTKSCHDIDFLLWMLCTPLSTTSSPHLPSTITSTGSLKYFRKTRKPAAAGTATNCLSCAHEPACLYSAKKIYLDKHLAKGNADWPVKIVNPEIEDLFLTRGKEVAVQQLLSDLGGDYTEATPRNVVEKRNWFGRCVWESDNDVCDDQIVTLTWDDDDEASAAECREKEDRGPKTALFHMIAHTEKQCERRGRIYGTTGELEYDSTSIRIHDFATGVSVTHNPHLEGGGHGGGDAGLARQFLRAVDAVGKGMESREAQRGFLGCDVEEAFRSHAMVFAAEEARRERKVVDWEGWWKENVESRFG